MKNLLQWYIDKRIRKAFEEKERAERERVERERIKKKEEAAEKIRQEIVDKCVRELISTGKCYIHSNIEHVVEYDPFNRKSSSVIRERIRQRIAGLILSRAFYEKMNISGSTEFRLSDGLRKDLQ